MTSTETAPALSNFLSEPLRVGDPDVAGPLAVYPLFGPAPRQGYLSFAQARDLGAQITELEGGASVRELVVQNKTSDAVLLYEGEEVLGAQQNRNFDRTILVRAGEKVVVPVSCVEAGRWEGSRRGESLTPAPQMAYPDLRRQKAEQMRREMVSEGPARADQGEVWGEVAAKSARLQVHSTSGAMHDIYESHRSALAEMAGSIKLRPGQSGAIVAIGGSFKVLDHVSRPDAYRALHAPLVQGYALDAIEADEAAAPSLEAASGFALLVADCEPAASRGPVLGLGEHGRFAANGVAGTSLVHEDELVALTAFPEGEAD
ncbi:MAG: hypothetical protein EXQ70_11935 [Solirubrobacterales bacterium]|nr:hypothetical protein [Solirubrobacterales bacterium]